MVGALKIKTEQSKEGWEWKGRQQRKGMIHCAWVKIVKGWREEGSTRGDQRRTRESDSIRTPQPLAFTLNEVRSQFRALTRKVR